MTNHVPYLSGMYAYGPNNRNILMQVLNEIYSEVQKVKVTVSVQLAFSSTLAEVVAPNIPATEELADCSHTLTSINKVCKELFNYTSANYELPFSITETDGKYTVRLPDLETLIKSSDNVKIEIGQITISPVLQEIILRVLNIPHAIDPEVQVAANKLYNQMYLQALQATYIEEA